jgi:hypothetical protein
VRPNQKSSATNPQSGSIEYLGQEPDVLLHGSGNWIKGKNTGASQDDGTGTGNKVPPAQFTPTGKIKAYKPDPSLHGPQSPSATSGSSSRSGPIQLSRRPKR